MIQSTSLRILEHLAYQVEHMPKTTGTRLEHTVTETREGEDGAPKKTTVKMTNDIGGMVDILQKFAAMYGMADGGSDTDIEDLRDLRKAVFGDFPKQNP